jgi:hypothetical protein
MTKLSPDDLSVYMTLMNVPQPTMLAGMAFVGRRFGAAVGLLPDPCDPKTFRQLRVERKLDRRAEAGPKPGPKIRIPNAG